MEPIQILRQYQHRKIEGLETNNAELVGFSLRNKLLPHSRFKHAIAEIAQLHHYSKQNEVGGGLVITGPSGVGKTTILNHYLAMFPRVHEAQKTRIPVLRVTTPASPTVRSMAEAILIALGANSASRGSAEERTLRIYNLLKVCEVELILIDEFQHFYYAHSIVEFRRISDWLKNLISLSGLAVILCGLPETEAVVKSNEQLNRRFSSKLALTPFSLEDEVDFTEFRSALKEFQGSLPMTVEVPLFEANLARRFLIGGGGLLDYVRKILEGSVSIATHAGHQSLDLGAYQAGFRKEVWSDVPDRLNPFHQDSPLRMLDRVGEPFYNADRRNAIGSPLARRLGTQVEAR
jgi:DNA transposition AAA+ family ATPase